VGGGGGGGGGGERGGFKPKNPSVGGVWIFAETTQNIDQCNVATN